MSWVAIIGGGITGLTAAFSLRKAGIPTTLYEASSQVGGVIRTIEEDGYLAECGPNTLLETSPRIQELVHDLGLKDRCWYSDPGAEKRFIVRGKQPVNLPGSAVGFFRTPLFSLPAKLRLFAEPFIPRSPKDREESLAEFVLRRMGREFLDYAINPFVAGVYAGDPAKLSVLHAFPKLHALEQRYGSLIKGQILGARERKKRGTVSKQNAKKISFDQGLQVLTNELGKQLGEHLQLGIQVKGLVKQELGWRLRLEGGADDLSPPYQAVFFALPSYRIAELAVDCLPQVDLAPFGQIKYPPVASVVLGFRREDVVHPLDGFGMLIPQVEGFNSLGCIFSSSLFRGRAPAGHVTLTSYIGGTRAPEAALAAPETLYRQVLDDLKILVGLKGEPTFRHHCVYPHAIPQYEVGYGVFKEAMSRIESEHPGLFFGGHYRDGISLSDSLVAGFDNAGRIATSLQP